MNDLTYIIAIFDTYFCFISYREYNYMLFFYFILIIVIIIVVRVSMHVLHHRNCIIYHNRSIISITSDTFYISCQNVIVFNLYLYIHIYIYYYCNTMHHCHVARLKRCAKHCILNFMSCLCLLYYCIFHTMFNHHFIYTIHYLSQAVYNTNSNGV